MGRPDTLQKQKIQHTTNGGQPTSLIKLAQVLNELHPVSSEAIAYLANNCKVVNIKKRSYLLSPGEVCENLYFISSGMLRSFIKIDGKEVTTWIDMDGEISTSIRGLAYRAPTLEYLQAIEDSELVALSFEQLDYVYTKFPEMNVVGRKFLEQCYVGAEDRAYILRIPAASSKYTYLMQTRPEIINRVPLKYIASFLGMTIETLSRIRNGYSKNI